MREFVAAGRLRGAQGTDLAKPNRFASSSRGLNAWSALPLMQENSQEKRERQSLSLRVITGFRSYLIWPTIHFTVASTWASVSDGLPPLGGMVLPSGPL